MEDPTRSSGGEGSNVSGFFAPFHAFLASFPPGSTLARTLRYRKNAMVRTEKETKNLQGEITPMFANSSMSRIARNAALLVASLSLCGLVLGAPRRGDDHGRGHKSDNVISIQYGSPFPSGSGTSTVRTDGLGKNDDNGRRHNSDNVITIQYGSPFPSGSGTSTARTDGLGKNDDNGRRHNSDNVITIQYGSPFPSGSGTSTVRTDGLGKNDDNGRRHNSDNVITIQYGSPFPSGSGTSTVRTDGL